VRRFHPGLRIARREPKIVDQLAQELPSEVRTWIGRQLFEHVPNNIAVIDRDFNVVVANSHFKSVFGDPRGKHCYEVYKSRDSICEQCMAARTFEDGIVRVTDEDGFDKNGRPAHYVVHIAPVYDEVGQIAYVIEMSYDLTETKSLQREYNLLFERVPCYVSVINRDLRIVRANALLRETFGDCVGDHCYEVYKHRTSKCHDCPALKTFSSGGSFRAEQVGVDKDGEPTHYIVSTSPLARSDHESSHVIEMMLDVTDVHKLSAELVKQSSFRNILIENTLDSLVAVDDAGVVNIFNQAAESLFKVASDSVINTAQGDRFLPQEFLAAIDNGRTNLSLAETNVVDVEGEEIPVRFSGSILRDGEKRIGAAAFFQDLRELKKLESEKLENERLAAVGQTVAQLAHGIKNILTGLAGGMYAIKSGMKSGKEERITKGWEMLERNTERITTLVKGFLSYSKKHVPKMEEIDPRELAREVFSLYYAGALKSGVTLVLDADEAVPAATMDPSDIHTCLANLVSNAIDACKTSGKEECGVIFRVKQGDDSTIFEVEDTGCGMTPDIRDKVFNSFFTTKGLGGTGLGLLVTKKIVREHGGHIDVESEPGEGSRFRLEIPRQGSNRSV
jgi:PAS domain S-box-containing protein